MKKILTLVILAAMTMGSVKAQFSVGLTGGIDMNRHDIDFSYATSYSSHNGNGGAAMVFGQYDCNNWLGIRVDAGWMQRNYYNTLEVQQSYGLETQVWHYTRNYFMLPVTSSFFYADKGFRVNADLGIYGGYWMNGSVIYIDKYVEKNGYQTEVIGEKYEFNKNRDVRFDFGITTRIGVSYTFKCNLFLMLEGCLNRGLINNHKTGSEYFRQDAYDYTLSLQFGIGYRFKNNKK